MPMHAWTFSYMLMGIHYLNSNTGRIKEAVLLGRFEEAIDALTYFPAIISIQTVSNVRVELYTSLHAI